MNCGGARKLFGAYWDDETTLAEREWLESHFNACNGCRTEYEQFARAIELVGSLPRAEVHPELAERALVRARRAGVATDRLPLGAPRWIPITATAALLAIAATLAMQWMGVPPPGGSGDPAPIAGNPPAQGVQPVGAEWVPPAEPEDVLASGRPGGAVDSLFDRSADVEFILDPVVLHKGRAHTALKLNPSVKGETATITF